MTATANPARNQGVARCRGTSGPMTMAAASAAVATTTSTANAPRTPVTNDRIPASVAYPTGKSTNGRRPPRSRTSITLKFENDGARVLVNG